MNLYWHVKRFEKLDVAIGPVVRFYVGACKVGNCSGRA